MHCCRSSDACTQAVAEIAVRERCVPEGDLHTGSIAGGVTKQQRKVSLCKQLFPALLAPCKAEAVSITLKDKITPGSPLSDCPCALPGQLSLTEVAFFSCRILGAGHDPPRVLLVCRRGLVC